MMSKFLIVFLGGGIGSVLRYSISLLVGNFSLKLPVATLVANVLSCGILSLIIYLFSSKLLIPEVYKLFILIGLCGGLSTFSTFSLETYELILKNDWIWALINVILNTVICICIFIIFNV